MLVIGRVREKPLVLIFDVTAQSIRSIHRMEQLRVELAVLRRIEHLRGEIRFLKKLKIRDDIHRIDRRRDHLFECI